MRLNGEISSEEDKVKETNDKEVSSWPYTVGGDGLSQSHKVVVGYALTSKKKKSFLQPKFIGFARSKGIFFVAIDRNSPLSEQGPFDVLLHKLNGIEWCELVKDYELKHPEVTIIDPPYAIQHLHNRQSMLQNVGEINFSDCNGKVFVPRQLAITKDPLSIPHEVAKAGMKLPLDENWILLAILKLWNANNPVPTLREMEQHRSVAKPLVVDGSVKSHELFLAYDEFSLSELKPPLVLQEFVNHGINDAFELMIFIVGEAIKVVRRFSLPNVSEKELSKVAGIFRFPRVSCATASADDADLDPSIAEYPPRPLLERLAKELRLRLGLRLFNIDMIREHGTKDVFYVIDINYFPGYGKMPDYEHMFTDFLLSLVQGKLKKRAATLTT